MKIFYKGLDQNRRNRVVHQLRIDTFGQENMIASLQINNFKIVVHLSQFRADRHESQTVMKYIADMIGKRVMIRSVFS